MLLRNYSKSEKIMIIGLTGSYCSGKDTVAEYLVENKGFTHYSLSDVIRDEMRSKGIEVTRENLIREGTALRANNGNAVLAVLALKKCAPEENCIISSIRHPAEVVELKKRNDFILVNVDAPERLRFERMQKRNRENDPRTFELFQEFEKRESQTEGPGQQVTESIKMADIVLVNDAGTLEELHAKIEKVLTECSRRTGEI